MLDYSYSCSLSLFVIMRLYESVFLCSVLWILSSAVKDYSITCLSSEDCVLPCQFQSDGEGVRVMWYKKKSIVSCTRYGNTSFVVGHNSPADGYKGRTRLDADQVLKGNAALVLKNITPKDQGKYFCITYTAQRTEESAAVTVDVKVADVVVSCGVMESCILPCSFQAGPGLLIHWFYGTAGRTPVHSYYRNQDQLSVQDQRFRGRTSLFKDQISSGNASLQLTGVKVQDQGLYQCYTSTDTEKRLFISLKVDAPVRDIIVQRVGNSITCSSEGIYPEPELTWSTSPPSDMSFTTTVQQTEQQLYNISSSLILSDCVTCLKYSCTISTRRNRQSADISWATPVAATWLNATTVIGLVVAVLVVIVGLIVFCIHRRRTSRDKKMSVPSVLNKYDMNDELKESSSSLTGR